MNNIKESMVLLSTIYLHACGFTRLTQARRALPASIASGFAWRRDRFHATSARGAGPGRCLSGRSR